MDSPSPPSSPDSRRPGASRRRLRSASTSSEDSDGARKGGPAPRPRSPTPPPEARSRFGLRLEGSIEKVLAQVAAARPVERAQLLAGFFRRPSTSFRDAQAAISFLARERPWVSRVVFGSLGRFLNETPAAASVLEKLRAAGLPFSSPEMGLKFIASLTAPGFAHLASKRLALLLAALPWERTSEPGPRGEAPLIFALARNPAAFAFALEGGASPAARRTLRGPRGPYSEGLHPAVTKTCILLVKAGRTSLGRRRPSLDYYDPTPADLLTSDALLCESGLADPARAVVRAWMF